MLKTRTKTKIITDFQAHDTDTGSTGVQIAIFTKQIDELSKHLKKHSKDNHSRRGLLQLVSKRKKLIDYLKKTDARKYKAVATKLGLKQKK